MQGWLLLAGGWATIAYIIYTIAARITLSHRRAAKAKEWKCVDVRVLHTDISFLRSSDE